MRSKRTPRAALVALTLVLPIAAACTPRLSSAPPDVEAMIREAFDPIGRGDEAVTVARCESGLQPDAQNGQYVGVFQLGAHFEGRANAYGASRWDPWVNIQVARDTVAHDGGWSQWTCKP